MAGRRTRGADDSRCPSCAAPVLTQWVGQRAALKATVELAPLTPEQAEKARGPNRLIWCLYQPGPHTPPRLRWTGRWHPTNCPHPHVTEHRCTAEPTTLF